MENMLQKEQEPEIEAEMQGIISIMNGKPATSTGRKRVYPYSNSLERLVSRLDISLNFIRTKCYQCLKLLYKRKLKEKSRIDSKLRIKKELLDSDRLRTKF